MGFKILKSSGLDEPRLTIRKDGIIAFNANLKKETAQYSYVELYYDKESNKLGFKMLTEASADSCKIAGGHFSVRSRVKGILAFEKNLRFQVSRDGELYVVDLDKGEETKPRVSHKSI